MRDYLEFEKPIREIEERIEKLTSGGKPRAAVEEETRKLKARLAQAEHELYSRLTPWQRAQIARHPHRPSVLDYIATCCRDFIELHGDRAFGDDRAIVGGLARFGARSVVVIGHQKGKTLKERMERNFGMPNPEGYRKALRLMKLAEKFRRPVISFIDTPGAYPGIGAEERGQAEAIAVNLEVMSALSVPSISVVIGEGASGGAIGIGVTNRILMLQYAWYNVISPESCSSILYRDATKAQKSAEALKLTAKDLESFGIIDEIVREAPGGAHRDLNETAANVHDAITRHLRELKKMSGEQLVKDRYDKFRAMGV